MNNMLIIETASAMPFLFLKKKNTNETLFFENGKNLSKNIHRELSALLSKYSLLAKDLDAIAIGIGPGSYTGLRVGVAIAKTLSYALEIPLLPFYSHEAFLPEGKKNFAILFDARSQGLYIYTPNTPFPTKMPTDTTLEMLKKFENIYTPDLLLIEKLKDFSNPIHLCKPHISTLIDRLKLRASNKVYNKISLAY